MSAAVPAGDGPHVSSLSIAPIKGFAMQPVDELRLEATGALRDREFVVVDAKGQVTSLFRTGAFAGYRPEIDREHDVLTVHHRDGGTTRAEIVLGAAVEVDHYGIRSAPARLVEGPWSALLSELAGEPVRLARYDGPASGADVRPLTLLGDSTVDRLAAESGVDRVDARRFRMTIGLGGTPAHAEDGWDGRLVRIGEAVLDVGGPVPRCAAVTRHPDTGDRDLPLVATIKRYRGMCDTVIGPGVPFGVYARATVPGTVRVGDPLELLR